MRELMTNAFIDLESCPSETLLATVLCAGSANQDRLTRATRSAAILLSALGGLAGVSRATADEIETELAAEPSPHLARRAAARRLEAAFALGRRADDESAALPASITSSADVAAWASTRLSRLEHEELWLLALDGRSRLRAIRCVAKGGLHGMGARAADPLRLALRASASGFVLVHNHPSGDPTPSAEDIAFTLRVADAAAVVGVPLLDHVVVARDGFSSVPFPADDSSRTEGANA
jgi:DNA repair protein RadC